jgi:hypothetical protein
MFPIDSFSLLALNLSLRTAFTGPHKITKVFLLSQIENLISAIFPALSVDRSPISSCSWVDCYRWIEISGFSPSITPTMYLKFRLGQIVPNLE